MYAALKGFSSTHIPRLSHSATVVEQLFFYAGELS